jgi:uncharacterized protein YvpB
MMNFLTLLISAQFAQWYMATSAIAVAILISWSLARKSHVPRKALFLYGFFITLFLSSWALLIIPAPQLIEPQLPLFEPISVTMKEPLTLTFDRPISKKLSATITPEVPGTWALSTHPLSLPFNQLEFAPAGELEPDTEYSIELTNIAPLTGVHTFGSSKMLFVFKTPPADTKTPRAEKKQHITEEPRLVTDTPDSITVSASEPREISTPTPTKPQQFTLNVPLYKQHYTFTCFSVAAKMALGYRGIIIDEIGFLQEIGFDQTPRNFVTNTWGNPNEKVVGTYNGSGDGGYGVHWEPVANTMSKYRKTKVIHHGTIPDLLNNVAEGNPVMVWWVNGVWPAKDVSWNLPVGGKVYTVNGMHVEVVVGWTGSRDNPQYILTNDPWRGRRHYTPAQFLKLWKWFDNTGVVVY